MTKKTEDKINVVLSVIQWNVIISSVKALSFADAEDILKEIGKQTEGSNAKGHEEIIVSFKESQVKSLISFLQFMPYNVIARIMYTLYSAYKEAMEKKEKPKTEETEVEIKVEE